MMTNTPKANLGQVSHVKGSWYQSFLEISDDLVLREAWEIVQQLFKGSISVLRAKGYIVHSIEDYGHIPYGGMIFRFLLIKTKPIITTGLERAYANSIKGWVYEL